MNRILRTASAHRARKGFTVYEVMLIIACVAVALALFFSGYEYVSFYRGPAKPYKFDKTASQVPVARTAPAAPAAATTAPAPATTAPAAATTAH